MPIHPLSPGWRRRRTPAHSARSGARRGRAGVPTTANSYIFEDFLPPFDATAVARLKAAGGIVLGKTQMGPLATTPATTPNGVVTTVNAWTPTDPGTNPGGSSTGTATAVAGRMVTCGIGTQTGGSITSPSNAQNLTGLKPTMGRASIYGNHPAHPHPRPPGTSATAAARSAFLATLADILNATIVEVPLPEEWALLTGNTFNNIRLPERSEPFLPQLRTDLRLFGVSVTSWLQGALLGANEFLIGQRAKLLLLERVLDDLFDRCDVVVQTSPVPFDILGLPELALPIGFTAAGVPIGTILGGLPYAEDRLLSVAAAYQAVTDWHLRRPPNPPGAVPPPTPVDAPTGRQPFPNRPTGRQAAAPADASRGRLRAEEVLHQTQ